MKKTLLCLLAFTAVNIYAQVDVTATVGTPATTYPTVKDAFDAINLGTHQGAVNLSITASTTETAAAVLNSSPTLTSVMIQPSAGTTATISGAIAAGPLVRILASNVIIDGSNNGSASRNLTFTNTSITTPQVLAMGSPTAGSPMTNVMVKNTTFINGVNSSSAVVISDGAGLAGYFNNVTFENNSVQKAYIGIFFIAATAVGNGANVVATKNDLTTSGVNAIRLVGIYLQGVDGGTVSDNMIGNFENTFAEIKRGVWFATSTINSKITGNTISNLGSVATGASGGTGISISSGNVGANSIANILVEKNTISDINVAGTSLTMGIYLAGLTFGTKISQNNISKIKNTQTTGYGAEGIGLLGTALLSNTYVTNNFISDVSAKGYAGSGYLDNGYGIHVNAGTGYYIYYNTVNLNASQTAVGRPAALNVAAAVAAGAIDLRNNILVTSQTMLPTYAIYSASPNAVFTNIDYNNYASSSFLGYVGSDRSTLADIQTGFGSNVNSLNVTPTFVSANDLHLVSTLSNNALKSKATPLAAVTIDYDGATRDAVTPDMGGDEFVLFVAAATSNNAKISTSVYPNPTTDIVNFRSAIAISNVEIYSADGKRMGSQTFNNSTSASVSLGKLPAGLYLLKVKSGVNTEVVKVIKK